MVAGTSGFLSDTEDSNKVLLKKHYRSKSILGAIDGNEADDEKETSKEIPDEDEVENRLSDKLMKGYMLLEQQCPVCSIPLVKEPAASTSSGRSEGEEDGCSRDSICGGTKDKNNNNDESMNSIITTQTLDDPIILSSKLFEKGVDPLVGIPFCVMCHSHIITDQYELDLLEAFQTNGGLERTVEETSLPESMIKSFLTMETLSVTQQTTFSGKSKSKHSSSTKKKQHHVTRIQTASLQDDDDNNDENNEGQQSQQLGYEMKYTSETIEESIALSTSSSTSKPNLNGKEDDLVMQIHTTTQDSNIGDNVNETPKQQGYEMSIPVQVETATVEEKNINKKKESRDDKTSFVKTTIGSGAGSGDMPSVFDADSEGNDEDEDNNNNNNEEEARDEVVVENNNKDSKQKGTPIPILVMEDFEQAYEDVFSTQTEYLEPEDAEGSQPTEEIPIKEDIRDGLQKNDVNEVVSLVNPISKEDDKKEWELELDEVEKEMLTPIKVYDDDNKKEEVQTKKEESEQEDTKSAIQKQSHLSPVASIGEEELVDLKDFNDVPDDEQKLDVIDLTGDSFQAGDADDSVFGTSKKITLDSDSEDDDDDDDAKDLHQSHNESEDEDVMQEYTAR